MVAGQEKKYVIEVKRLGGGSVSREEFPVTFVRRVQDDSLEVWRRALDRAVEVAKEHGWTPGTAVTSLGPMPADENRLRAHLAAGGGQVIGDVRVSVVRHNLGYGSV